MQTATEVCDHCGDPIIIRKQGKTRPSKYDGKFWCRNKRPCYNARYRYINSLRPKAPPRLDATCINCGSPCRKAADKLGQFWCQAQPCRRRKQREKMARYAAEKRSQGIYIFGDMYRRPGSSADHSARRRAAKRGADAESFTSAEIFERDDWLCGLCLMPVDPEVRWPSPFSASLDHVVPLARGGSHTRANVQCSHLTCNCRKRAGD